MAAKSAFLLSGTRCRIFFQHASSEGRENLNIWNFWITEFRLTGFAKFKKSLGKSQKLEVSRTKPKQAKKNYPCSFYIVFQTEKCKQIFPNFTPNYSHKHVTPLLLSG